MGLGRLAVKGDRDTGPLCKGTLATPALTRRGRWYVFNGLLIEVQVDVARLKRLDSAQQVERTAKPIDRPSHHRISTTIRFARRWRRSAR